MTGIGLLAAALIIPVHSNGAERPRPLITQNFNWSDAGLGATYVFGEDGYLKMDGSYGKVDCARSFSRPIDSSEGSVELAMRVVLGHRYHLVLTSSPNAAPVDCLIDENGVIRFSQGGKFLESGRELTFYHGRRYNGPDRRRECVVESDEHRFRFERFDFSGHGLVFVLDGLSPVLMPGCLAAGTKELTGVRLYSECAGPGNMIRLHDYAERGDLGPLDRESFPLYWQPIPAPAEGMPDDNVTDTATRPVGRRWLEMSTQYGYVKAAVAPLRQGRLECELKTADVANEACLVLEEYNGTIKSTYIQVGLLHGGMSVSISGGVKRFDDVALANNRVYHIAVAWDGDRREYRVWVDGRAEKVNGSERIPLVRSLQHGVDRITLHAGDYLARMTRLEKAEGMPPPLSAPPLRTYWGNFVLYDAYAPPLGAK